MTRTICLGLCFFLAVFGMDGFMTMANTPSPSSRPIPPPARLLPPSASRPVPPSASSPTSRPAHTKAVPARTIVKRVSPSPLSPPLSSRPTLRPISQGASQLTPRPIPQPTSRPISQPISRPISRPVIRRLMMGLGRNQPTTRPVPRRLLGMVQRIGVKQSPTQRGVLPRKQPPGPTTRMARIVPLRPKVQLVPPRIRPQVPKMLELNLPFDPKTGVISLRPGIPSIQNSQVGGVTWFQITIDTKGWYLFDTQGHADPFCRLYGKNFALLARNDDSGEHRNCRMFQELQPGTYYWEVMLFPYKSATFRASFQSLPVTKLAENQNTRSNIAKAGELKLFQVQVKKQGLYRFGTEGSTDVVCSLLEMSLETLNFRAVDDDSGPRTNCLLLQVLQPGVYTYLVRAAYFHRQGVFSVQFRAEEEDRLKFYAITFGEQMRAKLDSARHRHRYHFRLLRQQRVSFLAQFQRNTPQLLLLDIHGNILVDTGYAAYQQGKIVILSRQLPVGEYYLEVRSPGKPYAPYLLWAYQDQDVSVSTNYARLLSAGTPSSIDWSPYEYALFRVSLHAEKYHVIESRHPAAVACFLEDQQGQAVMKRQVSQVEPGICRIEGHGRQGTFWVRVLLHHKRQKKTRPPESLMQRGLPERTATSPEDTKHHKPGQHQDQPKPRVFKDRETDGDSLIEKNTKDGLEDVNLKRKEPGGSVSRIPTAVIRTTTEPDRLLLWNTNPAAQIHFFAWKPRLLELNQVKSIQSTEDSMGIRLDVNTPDLYWFSARNGDVQDCKILDLYLRFLKQASVFPNGCDIAAYLLRGSYVVRMVTKHQPTLKLEWRTFRAFPSAMTGDQILVGPIRKGSRRRFQMKITQSGFYRVESHLVSPVTLVTRVRLFREGRLVVQPYIKSYRVMSYLPEGEYEIEVEVAQGRGAYALTRHQIHTRTLQLGRSISSRWQGKTHKHYYALQVKQHRNYQLEARGGTDIYCRLYSAKGAQLRNSVAGRTQPLCKIEQSLAPGLYLLEVGSAFRDTVLYQLIWRSVLAKPSNLLALKQIQTGRLHSRRDEHRYTIQIQRPGTYVIETRNPAGTNTDPKCYLYKDGRLMRYNDDGGIRFNCKITQALPPGRYVLVIKLAWSSRTGPYSVAIYPSGESFPGETPVPKRPAVTAPPKTTTSGSSSLSGLVLRPGLRTQALVVRQNRVDIYLLKIDYAGRYRIETDGNLDTKCFLDDHKEQTIAVNDDGGQGANCKIKAQLPSGLYFIRVLARPLGRIGPYGLRIESD